MNYNPGQQFNIGLLGTSGVPVRVQHGKWKYKLLEEANVRLHYSAFPELHTYMVSNRRLEHPYYSIRMTPLHVELTAKRGYAFDGVTAASFLEDPKTLYRALWHDILMQAIYDHSLLPKSCIDESHKVFAVWRANLKCKFIYHSLNLLHKPWNKLKG